MASTMSSYIPTNGSTATRAAETLTIPAANLPWPSPRVIGEELVTNGTFDTDSDWTKGTGWTIGGGTVTHAAGSQSSLIQVISTTSAGNVYLLTFDYTHTAGANTVVFFAGVNIGLFNTSGTKQIVFVDSGANDNLAFQAQANAECTIDNISVKEIDPLAVSIQMEGRMTYAKEGAAVQYEFTRWGDFAVEDAIGQYLATNSSRTGAVGFRQRYSGVTDALASAADAYSPGVLVPFNIASRHGSTFINGAVDGTALTADTTPTALPDLSATDLNLGYDYMGTIKTFRMWATDLGDTGIAEASS